MVGSRKCLHIFGTLIVLCSITERITATSDGSSFARLVIESELPQRRYSTPATGVLAAGGPAATVAATAQERSYYRVPCPSSSECVPLSDCGPMMQEAARACFTGDRSLFCGTTDSDPYICCPRGGYPENALSCGKSLVQGSFYHGLGAFPFVTRVGFKNVNTGGLAYPCTGSIISRRVILTAAHCALAKAEGHRLSSVRIGEYDTARDPDCDNGFCAPSALNHAISHVIVHPDYATGQYHNDIALLILKTPINYTVAAQPVCLYPDRTNLIVGRRALITGWGKLSSSGARPPEMQFLEVPLTAWDACLKVYGATGALDASQSVDGQWMCAGGEGRDACQGYGGAPLVIKENGIYSQIGIMSFGSDNCGGPRIPSVYTSIAHFADWIRENSPVELQ